MPYPLRFWLTTLLFVAGLSTSPAFSNPFDFLFNAAPPEVAAPAPAEPACLPQPGKSTADGQHWVYRIDGRRKCWFQAAVGATNAKRAAHHHAAKHRVSAPAENHVSAPGENDAALRSPKAVVDARAELPRPSPAETVQRTPPGPEPRVSELAEAAATLVSSAVGPASDQPRLNDPTPPQVDVERLLATAPFASDSLGLSERPASPIAVPIAEAAEGEQGWTPTWLGMSLMLLGFVSLLGSRAFGGAALVGRLLDWRTKPQHGGLSPVSGQSRPKAVSAARYQLNPTSQRAIQ
ncbi:MAG TPA: hypothetical protein VI216_09440 [Candidatus Acidoferrales bacterium]|jgi:hypothetical protein